MINWALQHLFLQNDEREAAGQDSTEMDDPAARSVPDAPVPAEAAVPAPVPMK